MKLLFKFILSFLVIIAIGSSLVIVIYDFIGFRPYRARINAIINNTHRLHHTPPKAVYALATLSESNKRIKSYVAQSLLIEFRLNKHRMLRWHMEYALWNFLLGLHFEDKDVFVLWCHLSPFEKGRGLNNSANHHYGRNLDQLNNEELATIITIVKAPIFYKTHPIKLKKKVNTLLEEYANIGGHPGRR